MILKKIKDILLMEIPRWIQALLYSLIAIFLVILAIFAVAHFHEPFDNFIIEKFFL